MACTHLLDAPCPATRDATPAGSSDGGLGAGVASLETHPVVDTARAARGSRPCGAVLSSEGPTFKEAARERREKGRASGRREQQAS